MAVPLVGYACVVQRRCFGIVVRYGAVASKTTPERPRDIARYIERVAKEYDHQQKKQAKSRCAELVDKMCQNIGRYTTMEVRAVAHGIPLIFNKEVEDKWLQTIVAFTLKRASIMPVYFLYPLVNSICKMGGPNSEIPVEELMAVCLKRINEAGSIDLATLSQTALAWRSYISVNDVMAAIADATLEPRIIEEISATNAVLILYSFANLGVRNIPLCKKLFAVVAKMDHDNFQSHLIPLALHSLAKLKFRDEEATKAVVEHALKVVHKMLPEHLSSTLYGLARLKYNQSTLLREAAKRTKELIPSMSVRELSNIFWAFGKLRYLDDALSDAIIDRCLQYEYIDNMSFAQLLEAIRCYHLVDKRDSINELLKRYLHVMPSCSTQIVTQVAWCCCSLGHWDQDIIQRSLEELSSRDRAKREQKYVEMLLDALKMRGFQPEGDVVCHLDMLRTSREIRPTGLIK